ncbi:MAG: hypothetical protein R3B68_09635 [Phycisphaerales bacterium]
MAIDPRSLSAYRSAPIEGDVGCFKCGYNLKGLPRGGNCPECGGPIRQSLDRGRFLYKNLTDAPMSYLKIIRLGFFLLAGCVAALLVSIFWTVRSGGLAPAFLVAAASIAWWGGVYLVTSSEYPPGELHSKYDRLRWLRRTNRVAAGAWAAGWACIVVQMLLIAKQKAFIAAGGGGLLGTTPYDNWIYLAGLAWFVLQIVGLFSLIPLCIHLAEIASVAGADSLATRLGLAAWGIALFGMYLVAAVVIGRGGALGSILFLGFGLMSLGMLASVGLFGWSLIEMAIMSGYAVVNSYSAMARDKRLIEKAQREEAARQAELAKLPPLEFFQRPTASAFDEAPIPLEPERP